MSPSQPEQIWRRGSLFPLVISLLAAAVGPAAVAALVLTVASVWAGPTRPQPPPSRKEVYDPDKATCQPAHMKSAFHQQLAPYADQPEPVQARLRALQAELLHASLQRCIGRGLLTPVEASGLEQQLLSPPRSPMSGGGAQPSGQRP